MDQILLHAALNVYRARLTLLGKTDRYFSALVWHCYWYEETIETLSVHYTLDQKAQICI